MSKSLLEIKNVESGYGDVQVLWGISAAVENGEIACIVGSNGAGKTTLLRTISGLLPVKSGNILLGEEDISTLNPEQILRRGVAHVPEGRRLFKGLSVRDNLLLGTYLRDDRSEIQKDLDFVFDLFPILKERQNQDATTMSGGEQQMCAIGRGIMSRPKLLMIDELSLGLAPALVDRLTAALRSINSTGLSILLVEQDVMTAFEISNNAFVIETGRIFMSGKTKKLGADSKIREAYMGL